MTKSLASKICPECGSNNIKLSYNWAYNEELTGVGMHCLDCGEEWLDEDE